MSDDKELQAEGKLPDEDMCRCGHDKLYHGLGARHGSDEHRCGITGCKCLYFQNGPLFTHQAYDAAKAESLRKQAQADADVVSRVRKLRAENVQPVNDPISGIELFELIDEEMAIQGLPTGSKRSWLSRSERFQQAFNEVAKKLRWARE